MSYIMVLNDGTTYTDLAGCKIVRVPDDYTPEEIEQTLLSPGRMVQARFGISTRGNEVTIQRTNPHLVIGLTR